MPVLTEFQTSTITLLDYLYFHDIVALQTFSNEKKSFYARLIHSLRSIAEKRQFEYLKAEHYQHLLLVGMDLNASYIDDPSKLKIVDNEKFVRALNEELCWNVIEAGFCLDAFEQDLNDLLDEYPLTELSRDVLYKLVGQVMCYQFDNITICVLTRLLDQRFLRLEKYKKYDQTYTQIFLDIAFFRAMLFLEYEAFKNNLLLHSQYGEEFFKFNELDCLNRGKVLIEARTKAKNLNAIPYKKIYQTNLRSKKDVKRYLIDVEQRLGHKALLKQSLANWIGLIGAWHVMHAALTNPDRKKYRELEVASTIEPTWCEIAQKEMKEYGFRISERSLYDVDKCTEKFYELIGIAVNEVNKTKFYGALEPVLIQFFFFDPTIGPSFKNALEEVNTKLKNKKAKT